MRQLVKACETWTKWSQDVEDEGRTYKVQLITPTDPRLGIPFGYACNCAAFREEPGPCVHILIAQGFHCGWHEKFCDEKVEEEGKCPRCGANLVEVLYSS